MDVFSLRDSVVAEYRKFATSFTTIHAHEIREQVEAIYAQGRYWPEPLIQINPNYRRTTSVDALVASKMLEPECADIFRSSPTSEAPKGVPLRLFKHQEQAIALAAQGESFVVTTGTGSGKSLCFFIPIVNAVLAERRSGTARRTRAIVVYPMNALANSQLEELRKFIPEVGGGEQVTFARYTGQEDQDERRRVADNPPDILLTNFMMLELLMTRQDEVDKRVIEHCAGLRFLVLDELHTYRGRQGADVAMLVRRVRERLAPDRLQCIGTSATMASEGSLVEKNKLVAAVASKLFAARIAESSVVVETLERMTDPNATADSVRSQLGPAIDRGVRKDLRNDELRTDPLAVWVETRLGITWSDGDQRWVRARPLTVSEAVQNLSKESGRREDACGTVLRDLLLTSSLPEKDRTGSPNASPTSFFAFKLHQFISGAGHAYTTIEAPGERTVVVEGQQFLPGSSEKRLYPIHFCRDCGQEYYAVRFVTEGGEQSFRPRDIDDAAPPQTDEEESEEEDGDEGEEIGFATPHSPDEDFTFNGEDSAYPETWVDTATGGQVRLKSNYRKYRARPYMVEPTGRVGTGTKLWFSPGKFRLCLRCRATHGGAARDRNRLASLSAEGRSSATTVLVGSALRWMHEGKSSLDKFSRKLLGFTDNRQDAALQAGHFNDFLFVSLLRAGFLGALDAAGQNGLRSDELGASQQRTLGFDKASPELRAEWLLEPSLRGVGLQEAETTLRQVLAYRLWFDQRRGWRYTNPNLEQLGLVEVHYIGVEELAADDELFAKAPEPLRGASTEVRIKVYQKLLDYMRTWLAIRSQVLDPMLLEQLVARSHSRIRSPWGFGFDEKPTRARWLMVARPNIGRKERKDEDLVLLGSSRSALGMSLRSSDLWGGDKRVRRLKSHEFDAFVEALLRAASTHGLVSEEATPFQNQSGWRLNDACVQFKRRTKADKAARPNEFFRDFYETLSRMLRDPAHPLFGFEAREHTAQVEGERREVRERRFRYGAQECEQLAAEEKHLRELGEPGRFLPVLFCSPTMELGVDISALNAVYLRNVPPTPANYAQRSGRAGRGGQAALVLAYAAAQSPHDQYFFRVPKDMVHGEVRPPLIDLANRDLIDSHLQAVWLACTEKPLDPSIAKLLVLSNSQRPLLEELLSAMRHPSVSKEAEARIRRVLDLLVDDLKSELAPWFPGRDEYAAAIVQAALDRFDRAFDRWRDLFLAAEQQRDAARRTVDDYSAPPQEKRAAQSRQNQAIDQLSLLQKEGGSLSNDFYTYRYLATEGFLPGYNFPRLPLMAYIPATTDGKGRQTYVQRPRFLALAEFGPRSLVYHEGRAFRVVRALLALRDRESARGDVLLPTRSVRICRFCGAGHFEDESSLCHSCGSALGEAEIVNHIYRIENVGTYPAERITANDEERQRQGFDLQTTFQWATRDQALDVRHAAAADAEGDVLHLAYGTGATITRLNKGLRRRANKKTLGFRIDPVSGYWAKNADEEESSDPTASPRQWIVPGVQDRKNALLVRTLRSDLSSTTLATLQYATLRGIESVFELEEGEVLAEPMPTRDDRRGFLLYEAAEGGAGVLSRIAAEPETLSRVALKALDILHFAVGEKAKLATDATALTDAEGTSCVAACYRCLMSYYNQPDHEILDRRDIQAKQLLLRLARSTVAARPATAPSAPPLRDSADPVILRWLDLSRERGLPAPDAEALLHDNLRIPLVWRAHYVVAVIGKAARKNVTALEDKGFQVIVFEAAEKGWSGPFGLLAAALGRNA